VLDLQSELVYCNVAREYLTVVVVVVVIIVIIIIIIIIIISIYF
jgi:hypothetical protein